ncbi:response regulator [bacterium]|nr:response regulator [bacterium]
MNMPTQEAIQDKNSRRVLIVDPSTRKYEEVLNRLKSDGWLTRSTNDRNSVAGVVANFQPLVVIINLFMSNASTLKTIREIKELSPNTKIIVVTSHYSADNIRQVIRNGANDFVIEPFDTNLLLERIKFQLQEKSNIDIEQLNVNAPQLEADFKLLYECLRIMSEFRSSQNAMFETLKKIAEFSTASRVNIMLADLESPNAIVACSSDDPSFRDKSVELDRYSEVREVLLKNQIIHIKDITSNPLTADIKANVKSIDIQSLLVIPIRHRGSTIGALSIKLGKNGKEIDQNNLKTFFILAMALAPKIAGKKLMLDRTTSL